MKKPRRVCFVIDNLAAAGTEKQLLRLLNLLDHRLVKPHLVLLDGSSQESRKLEPSGIPIMRLELSKLKSFACANSGLRLARFFLQERIEIVLTYFHDSSNFAIPVAKLCGIRRVYRVRNNAGYAMTPKQARLDGILNRMTSLTITNGETSLRFWQGTGIPARRITLVPNLLPSPAAVFRPPFQGAVPVVGMVANLRPVKNVEMLIRVAGRLRDAGQIVEFRVAGEGPDRPRLEQLIRELALSDRFRLLGASDDVPEFLSTTDIAVLCSISESESNAVLEYLAAGKPILATDTGRNREWIEGTSAGRIVPVRDDEGFMRELGGMIADREGSHRMAKLGWTNYRGLKTSADTLIIWHRLLGPSPQRFGNGELGVGEATESGL